MSPFTCKSPNLSTCKPYWAQHCQACLWCEDFYSIQRSHYRSNLSLAPVVITLTDTCDNQYADQRSAAHCDKVGGHLGDHGLLTYRHCSPHDKVCGPNNKVWGPGHHNLQLLKVTTFRMDWSQNWFTWPPTTSWSSNGIMDLQWNKTFLKRNWYIQGSYKLTKFNTLYIFALVSL